MVSQDVPSGAHPSIRALGRVTDRQLAELYRTAWVFCLPSTYEGFGIPYAEAMASGLPVVATPNVGARYVTEEGNAGVLSAPAELGTALTDLLRSEIRQAQLRIVGLQRAREFDLSAVAERYETVYRRTIEGRFDLQDAVHGRPNA